MQLGQGKWDVPTVKKKKVTNSGEQDIYDRNACTINSRFKPLGLINFMVHDCTGSNRDY